MKRRIVGYHKDERKDWVAELDCGHNQHVRHRPPFQNRIWVTTEAGRERKLGTQLNCARCNRLELPEGLESYRRTDEFTDLTVPAGLLKDHETRQGVWGRIHVLEGSLIYTTPQGEQTLQAGEQAVVVPEMKHHILPARGTRFYVEFLRTPKARE